MNQRHCTLSIIFIQYQALAALVISFLSSLVAIQMRFLLPSFIVLAIGTVNGQVIISEIADKGSEGVCNGDDWVELVNEGTSSINLAGYALMDTNQNTFFFPPDTTIAANEYLLQCTQFGIAGDDTITLLNVDGETVSTVGPLPDTVDRAFDVSWARNATDGTFMYSTTPTPGAANILTPVETPEQIKQRLKAQNELGTQFFGMDDQGVKVANAYDDVLDLYITMNETDYAYLQANQSFEVYSPFTSARLATKANETIQILNSPGRIRPKGQSTLYFATCLGSPTMPFQIEFNTVNETQTLFGAQVVYLRNHLSDGSYMRDWASHRMLARFGLPHLRARKVRFYINGERRGLYTLLEAPDQDYVFARNFPSFDPKNHALFKVKTLSIGCGRYTDEQLAAARLRLGDTSAPPYMFERGTHRPLAPRLGPEDVGACTVAFIDNILNVESADAVLAYLRANEDCGTMLVKEGIIDRDLGGTEWEDVMRQFINDNLGPATCNAGCTNSNLAAQVNIENFLKNFAVYAVTLNGDSPMGNGNNYYLADPGDGNGWAIQQYDHNNVAADLLCDPTTCNTFLPDWSISRPTCGPLESNQIVGPLLTDPVLHETYISYVRSFVETVLGNDEFIQELMDHAAAIKEDVAEDFWSRGGASFDAELTPDGPWNTTNSITEQFPFLPLLKARTESVREQLAAIDAGTFPRGPHLEQGVEPWETCADWQSTEPPPTACFQNCRYEGCFKFGWTIPGVCDQATGTCIHGNWDQECQGVADGGRYEGMENREDGSPTFCLTSIGFPSKVSVCPAPSEDATGGDVTSGGSADTTSAAIASFTSKSLLIVVALFVPTAVSFVFATL